MIEELFASELPFIAYNLLRIIVIFIGSLGSVYIFHRMLDIKMGYRATNIIALITAVSLSYFSIYLYDLDKLVNPLEIYWRTTIYTFSSSILFVLLGWNLYDRVDNFLDKKFAPNEKTKSTKKK